MSRPGHPVGVWFVLGLALSARVRWMTRWKGESIVLCHWTTRNACCVCSSGRTGGNDDGGVSANQSIHGEFFFEL